MPLKIKKILKGLVLLVCVSYWESFTFNFICGLLQIPGTNHIMKSCSWDIGCVLLMLKEDPLREPLSGGEGKEKERRDWGRKKEGKQERGGEQATGWRKKREEGAKGRQRGGEGGSSQAALYPDRSPLHTNFLVKEEKMALNPEKSFSPGAGLSAEGWVDTSVAFLLRLAPPGTQQLGYRSQQSSLSIAIINTPSEYNEPYHDTWISVDAVDSRHLTARWKSNVKWIDFLIMSSPSQMANKSCTNISCSVAVHKQPPWQNSKPPPPPTPPPLPLAFRVTGKDNKIQQGHLFHRSIFITEFVIHQSVLARIWRGEKRKASFILSQGC